MNRRLSILARGTVMAASWGKIAGWVLPILITAAAAALAATAVVILDLFPTSPPPPEAPSNRRETKRTYHPVVVPVVPFETRQVTFGASFSGPWYAWPSPLLTTKSRPAPKRALKARPAHAGKMPLNLLVRARMDQRKYRRPAARPINVAQPVFARIGLVHFEPPFDGPWYEWPSPLLTNRQTSREPTSEIRAN
jgi:hypothetical protein